LIVLGATLALNAWAQEATETTVNEPARAPRPTEAIDPANCVTSECHSEIKGYAVLHGPVVADSCDACHKLLDAESHTFEIWRQDEKICTYCHEFDTGMLPVIHAPVIAGECLGCHNPHGGVDRSLTRETTMARTCGRCHESVTHGKEFLHHPVEAGECNTCHRPHASKFPNLLDAVGTNLCLTCHGEFGDRMAGAEFVHEPLKEGCTRCHVTHGSAYPMELTQAVPELCLDCHEDIGDTAAEAMYKHPPVTDECSCLTCHTAHGGNLASLMCDLPANTCMSCHEEKVTPNGAELMTAMIRLNDPTRFKHTPVREGQCGGCHSMHGGDLPLLLWDAYPTRFHQAFSMDNYTLCFDCHDERLVKNEKADGITDFRNGGRNLHFVHVAEGDFGRNCRVCHGVHTSKYPALVRDRVPYGNWEMSIEFEQWDTGGTCQTGCHPQLGYDRVNPMTTYTLALPARPLPNVPPADKQEPIRVKWSTRDIHGAEVTVPAPDRPTVLMFLRADQAQSRKAVQMVSAASPQTDQAQVVVIFCGEEAEEQARAFAATYSTLWHVVADPEHSLCVPLGVEVRPATLVVQDNEVLLTHMGGAPPSLTLELAAYLDLATQTINRDTLAQRLTEYGTVGDGPVKRPVWYLQRGRQLMEDGKVGEARDVLAKGMKLHPDSIELRVEMIRMLEQLNLFGQALELLGQIPEGALPLWEYDLLRARVLAGLGRWDEARRLAVQVLELVPNHGEAHYLMGMVYEHDREWEKAAVEFRAAYSKSPQ